MNQDDQDDHPDTPIMILGIMMMFGGGVARLGGLRHWGAGAVHHPSH